MSSHLSSTNDQRIKLEFIESSPSVSQTEIPSEEARCAYTQLKLNEETSEDKASLLKSVSHPKILYFQDSKVCHPLASEVKLKGNLLDLIESFKSLSSMVAKAYFHQLLDAIEHLHQIAGLCHGDLNLQNVLVDDTFNLKVTRIKDETPAEKEVSASTNSVEEFYCPEIWKGEPYNTFEADIFALGVILFEMVAGFKPFDSATPEDPLYNLLMTQREEDFWQFHEVSKTQVTGLKAEKGHFSPEFRDLINSLLAFEVEDRLKNVTNIRKYAWCQGMVLSDQSLTGLMTETAKKMCL